MKFSLAKKSLLVKRLKKKVSRQKKFISEINLVKENFNKKKSFFDEGKKIVVKEKWCKKYFGEEEKNG